MSSLGIFDKETKAYKKIAGTAEDALSSTSTNPVQNKVVKDALDHKLNGYTITYTVPANTGGWHKIAEINNMIGAYFNFDLYTTGTWTNQAKNNAHFQIQNINGNIRIVQLSGLIESNVSNGITKIRMVRVTDNKDIWILEEYSPSSTYSEFFRFTIAGDVAVTPLDGSVDTTTDFKDSVSFDVSDIPTGTVITTSNIDSHLINLKYGEVAGGKNLLNPNKTIIGELVEGNVDSGEQYVSDYIPIKSNTSYSISNCTQGSHEVDWYTSDKTYISRSFTTPVISPSNASYVRIEYTDNINAQLEEGSVATSYEPYIPSVKMLAEENAHQSTEMMDIKMLGWAVPRECPIQNEVNGNQFVQKVGRVDLGSLEWLEWEGGFYTQPISSIKYPTTSNDYANIYCYVYENIKSNDWLNKTKIGVSVGGGGAGTSGALLVYDTKYTDITTFKNEMQGQYLYYELATPIIKTIDGNEIGEAVGDIRKETTVNLLNPTLETTTHDGITCTNNGDGTYTLNGTATSSYAVFNLQCFADTLKKHLNEDLLLVGCPKSNGSYDCFIHLDNGKVHATDEGDGYKFNMSELWTSLAPINIEIHIDVGTTVNNIVFKPMITTNLNATYDDFVPYTGDTGKLNSDVAGLDKKIPTFERNDSVFYSTAGHSPVITGDTAGRFSAISDEWSDDKGRVIKFKNDMDTKTHITIYANVNVHNVLFLQAYSPDGAQVEVKSPLFFYTQSSDDNQVQTIACDVTAPVGTEVSIAFNPIVIKNV